MPDESGNVDSALEEQLVAYLDGELDAEARRRIEDLLTTDPDVRRKLQALDRTWELLDKLDGSQVAESFAHSTLEMVTVAASDEVQQAHGEASRRRSRRWAVAVGSLLVAALAGFFATAALAPNPNRELIRDLPMLEDLEPYRQVDDLEFLRALHREGLFAEEVSDEE